MWVVLLALLAAQPPDPRKGEPLDGRAAPRDPWRVALAVPRLILAGPRLAVRAALSPVVRATAYVEERGFATRLHDLVTSEDGRVGLRPDVRYESAFGWAAGARVFDRRTLGPGSLLQVRALGGDDLALGELRLRLLHGRVGGFARYERNGRALFRRQRYGVDRGVVGLESEHHLGRALRLRGVGDVSISVFDTGGSTRLATAGAELVLDTRRELFASGFTARAGAFGTRGFDGDPSRFVTLRAESGATLGLRTRDLSLRLRAGLIEPGAGGVPFDALLSPSGPDGLRGLATGELRGTSELLGTIEYRWQIVKPYRAALFVDYGGAFGDGFAGLSASRLEPALGGALRRGDTAVQLAFAPTGLQLVFGMGW